MSLAMFLFAALLAFGGEISDWHFKHAGNKFGDPQKSRTNDEVGSTNHGISEIGIERTRCYGACPAYIFIVKSNGTFRYKGTDYVERKGEFIGTIPVAEFHVLAQFIKDSGYMEMEEAYTRGVTENPTTFTMVVINGNRKTIRNYANAGPTKLWAIEQLIDRLMTKAKWSVPDKAAEKL